MSAHPPQIPLTPQTDARNFPVWDANAAPGKSGYAYPKMLTRVCTQQDRDDWLKLNRKIDTQTREEWYPERSPTPGQLIPLVATPDMVTEGLMKVPGAPIIVADAVEELAVQEWIKNHEIPIPVAPKKQHRKSAKAAT